MRTAFATVLCLSVVASFSAPIGTPPKENVIWELKAPKVISAGKSATSPEGTRVSDYVLELAVVPKGTALVPGGKMEVKLNVFSPAVNMPGQKAGRWYLRGTWTITSASAPAKVARHSADRMQGMIQGDLETNPLAGKGKFTAQALLPASTTAGSWAKGDGTLTFDKDWTGQLQLSLERWGVGLATATKKDGSVLMAGVDTHDVSADPRQSLIPGRPGVRGFVPNPGTQQQELTNITAPAPYNVFEFAVTCMACHGGSVDQNAGHGGNWAGTSMANAARDPVFRANQQVVDAAARGAGNMCMRCHSPNGWYSGRFDNTLTGKSDTSTMIQSPLLSTDGEGILCETCHRTIGAVKVNQTKYPGQGVWRLMLGIDDWPHLGDTYESRQNGPAEGEPYGDTTLQIADGMTYGGLYRGSAAMSFSDAPEGLLLAGLTPGPNYTGQTYGTYPPYYPVTINGVTKNLGNQAVVLADGSVPIQAEFPIGPPMITIPGWGEVPNYQGQAISLEHPTFDGTFIKSSRFCGSCHELTVPVVNHGMPEQRTWTEWKHSSYGQTDANGVELTPCQSCHMPKMKHEYADSYPATSNADPPLAGWFPTGYAKDRSVDGGTAFHKMAGSNRDLPDMMKALYPEVDLEVIGAPTLDDPTVFPGMMSDRRTMWDRNKRNSELQLNRGVKVDIVPNTLNCAGTTCEVRVQVTNTSGHRLPTGYPDGRRFWISLAVKNAANTLYESGVYDDVTATLYNDSTKAGFRRATGVPSGAEGVIVDSTTGSNAVMVYEKITGTCAGTVCTESKSLLNDKVLFDNRIPPAGFNYDAYRVRGAKFVTYNDHVAKTPMEVPARFTSNVDTVTYRFTVPAGTTTSSLSVDAAIYWQTHTREFMEHLRTSDNSTVRPQGPPSIYSGNYPNVPNYLGQNIGLANLKAMDGTALKDNWGGVAYAAWSMTGKGAPHRVSFATTKPEPALSAPTPAVQQIGSFALRVSWPAVSGAHGYILWVRYGKDAATADWDKVAVLTGGSSTNFLHEALNPDKTYAYRVQPFNSAGPMSEASLPITMQKTGEGDPMAPEQVGVISVNPAAPSIRLSWFDTSANETEWVIERQTVPVTAPWQVAAVVPSSTGPGNGAVEWTDSSATGLVFNATYNYRIAARNNWGQAFSLPVQASTQLPPTKPTGLTASFTGTAVLLNWAASGNNPRDYVVMRSLGAAVPVQVAVVTSPNPGATPPTTYTDTSIALNVGYSYFVFARNYAGDSAPTSPVQVSTSPATFAAPTNLSASQAQAAGVWTVTLKWIDQTTTETHWAIEQSMNGGAFGEIARVPTTTASTSGQQVTWSQAPTPNSTYAYRVRALRLTSGGAEAGAPSPYSNTATIVVATQVPETATLQSAAGGKAIITVAWIDNSLNETGFMVDRRKVGTTTWTPLNVQSNRTTATISGLAAGSYEVRVRAYNQLGSAQPSAVLTATVVP